VAQKAEKPRAKRLKAALERVKTAEKSAKKAEKEEKRGKKAFLRTPAPCARRYNNNLGKLLIIPSFVRKAVSPR